MGVRDASHRSFFGQSSTDVLPANAMNYEEKKERGGRREIGEH
jgi:hypothetical protein